MTADCRLLVVAKAPVTGRVKTRLGDDLGHDLAARLAAASLLDTLAVGTTAFGPGRCHLSLAGDLGDAHEAGSLAAHLAGWTVDSQRGDGFDERLANAHADVARRHPGDAVVQVGMDTPQLTAALLDAVADGLRDHDAVLGPAEDGGWWVLALRDPSCAAVLLGVPMSTPDTHDATLAALRGAGLDVGGAPVVRDVDTVADAEAVAAAAPATRFAGLWRHEAPR